MEPWHTVRLEIMQQSIVRDRGFLGMESPFHCISHPCLKSLIYTWHHFQHTQNEGFPILQIVMSLLGASLLAKIFLVRIKDHSCGYKIHSFYMGNHWPFCVKRRIMLSIRCKIAFYSVLESSSSHCLQVPCTLFDMHSHIKVTISVIREYGSTLYVGMPTGKNGQKYSLQKAFLSKKLKLSHKNQKTTSQQPILQLGMNKSYLTQRN